MSKVAAAPGKGQSSLFSFFKKSPAVVTTTPVAAVPVLNDPVDAVTTAAAVGMADDKPSYTVTMHELDLKVGIKHANLVDDAVQSKGQQPNAVHAKVQVDDDDDEEIVVNSSRTRKRVKYAVSDEEEWDEHTAPAETRMSNSSSDEESSFPDTDSDDDDGPVRKMRKPLKSKMSAPPPTGKPPLSVSKSSAPPPCTPVNKDYYNKQANIATSHSKVTTPIFASSKVSTPATDQSSNSSFSNNSMSQMSPAMLDGSPADAMDVDGGGGVFGLGNHEHDTWVHLKQIKDKSGLLQTHPDYNPRTWHVPAKFLNEQTPAMRQWFEIKADFFDVVLFFKVGKFYELFHMDADVGVKELDLIFMKGAKAHSGFPEISYGKYASMLVSKGYRVARVEQTETPEMMKEKNKTAKKGAATKVVSREMCSIISKGTRTYCHLDDLSTLDDFATGNSSSLLLCIKEQTNLAKGDPSIAEESVVEYGLCFVDTVLHTVTFAQFQDDVLRQRLRILLSRFLPTEILLEHGNISPETLHTVQMMAPKALVDFLRDNEMTTADETIACLHNDGYFANSYDVLSQLHLLPQNAVRDSTKKSSLKKCDVPPVLNAVLSGMSDRSSELCLSAFGGVLWALKRSLIDYEVLSDGKCLAYAPLDMAHGEQDNAAINNKGLQFGANGADAHEFMVLDATALANLEIMANNYDNSEKGSLWSFMNRCRTPYGKRLLRDWVCKPLFSKSHIDMRRDAIEELLSSTLDNQCEFARVALKGSLDLERLLSRVHSNGISKKDYDHPESRAIMYEDIVYSERKIKEFADTLKGFETLISVFENFSSVKNIQSKLLKIILRPTESGGKFPLQDIVSLLKHFRKIFDEKQARRDKVIKPLPGVDMNYDTAKEAVNKLESQFEAYLAEQKQKTGIKDLQYFGTNKDRYQLEVPISVASKVPSSWTSKSQKKTHRRYWTPYIEELLAKLVIAEDQLAFAEKDTMRRIFEKFDDARSVWRSAVECASMLDALLSLASVSASPDYCWPTFIDSKDAYSTLKITQGRHPMLEHTMTENNLGCFIANDLSLGGFESSQNNKCFKPKFLLLSGPNMGGKSTLLRQTCLIAIMAQIGCKVPASSVTMTPVDRIFTRIGASDKILHGQSTFFVELAETAVLLKHATKNSICILDELGRGTSTFDGTAIAGAVVEYLLRHNQCLSLFATHYHSLVNDLSIDPRIRLGHMDCMVEEVSSDSSNCNGSSFKTDDVTFLYHLRDGSSPRSYGINVAKLANLPSAVLRVAQQRSREFELSHSNAASGSSFEANKFIMVQYFERLVSLLRSVHHMNISELSWYASELWKGYVQVMSSNR